LGFGGKVFGGEALGFASGARVSGLSLGIETHAEGEGLDVLVAEAEELGDLGGMCPVCREDFVDPGTSATRWLGCGRRWESIGATAVAEPRRSNCTHADAPAADGSGGGGRWIAGV